MQGTIRFILGLLVVLAAVGAAETTAEWQILALAATGLAIMWSGARALERN